MVWPLLCWALRLCRDTKTAEVVMAMIRQPVAFGQMDSLIKAKFSAEFESSTKGESFSTKGESFSIKGAFISVPSSADTSLDSHLACVKSATLLTNVIKLSMIQEKLWGR